MIEYVQIVSLYLAPLNTRLGRLESVVLNRRVGDPGASNRHLARVGRRGAGIEVANSDNVNGSVCMKHVGIGRLGD